MMKALLTLSLASVLSSGCDDPRTTPVSQGEAPGSDSNVGAVQRRNCKEDEKRAAWILECMRTASSVPKDGNKQQDAKDVISACQTTAEDTMCPTELWCYEGKSWVAPCSAPLPKCEEACKGTSPVKADAGAK